MAEAEASKSVAIRGRLGTWPSMAVGVVVVGRVRIPPAIKGVRKIGGGGGIRTHVAARTAKSISSRPRYGHFGTPPRRGREVL